MAGLDWEQIVAEEDDPDGDVVYLPQPEIIALDQSGQHQKIISYEWDDPNDKTVIIRREKKIQIIETNKKISKAAIARKKTWVKFGVVKNEPKGSLEKGITSQRNDDIPFLWNGMSLEKINKKKQNKMRDMTFKKKMSNLAASAIGNVDDKKSSGLSGLSKTGLSSGRKYRPPTQLLLDEMFEIRISNLPDWTEWAHIKELIDAFYRNYLKVFRPPRYKIRMFTTRYDQEKNAIVEFDNENYAKAAIKELNGHQYEYHILKVEKSIPRPR